MSVYNQIADNQRKTWFLVSGFVLLVTLISYLFGQTSGYGWSWAVFSLFIASTFSLASYFFSDSIVLTLVGAKEMKNTPGQDVFDLVTNLSMAAGIPAPKLYLVNDSAPNAFATGRDPAHAVICVNSGLLEILDKSELEGVIAHEISHIKNYDTRLSAMVVVLVGLVSVLAEFFLRSMWWSDSSDRKKSGNVLLILGLVAAIISPLVAQLIQFAISRQREFLADASGAYLTRFPEGLARALEKISQTRVSSSKASHAMAHLYFENPFRNVNKNVDKLASMFNTHPPVAERIAALRKM